MTQTQVQLIKKARSKFGRIYPCGNKSTLSEGFNTMDGQEVFWFNTEDDSTHAVKEEKNGQ